MLRLTLGLILIALPVVELALLIKTGQAIGLWATLGLVVAAGLLGALILAHQGLSVLRRTQQSLAQGRPPVAPVLDGVFLLLAGALLITPGFLTDVLALLLLIPAVRRGVARWGVKQLVKRAQVQFRATGGRIDGAPGNLLPLADRRKGPSSRANSSAWGTRQPGRIAAKMAIGYEWTYAGSRHNAEPRDEDLIHGRAHRQRQQQPRPAAGRGGGAAAAGSRRRPVHQGPVVREPEHPQAHRWARGTAGVARRGQRQRHQDGGQDFRERDRFQGRGQQQGRRDLRPGAHLCGTVRDPEHPRRRRWSRSC